MKQRLLCRSFLLVLLALAGHFSALAAAEPAVAPDADTRALEQELADGEKSLALAQGERAQILAKLANVHIKLNQPAAAAAKLETVIVLLEQLAKAKPDDPAAWRDLGLFRNQLARGLQISGDLVGARKSRRTVNSWRPP